MKSSKKLLILSLASLISISSIVLMTILFSQQKNHQVVSTRNELDAAILKKEDSEHIYYQPLMIINQDDGSNWEWPLAHHPKVHAVERNCGDDNFLDSHWSNALTLRRLSNINEINVSFTMSFVHETSTSEIYADSDWIDQRYEQLIEQTSQPVTIYKDVMRNEQNNSKQDIRINHYEMNLKRNSNTHWYYDKFSVGNRQLPLQGMETGKESIDVGDSFGENEKLSLGLFSTNESKRMRVNELLPLTQGHGIINTANIGSVPSKDFLLSSAYSSNEDDQDNLVLFVVPFFKNSAGEQGITTAFSNFNVSLK